MNGEVRGAVAKHTAWLATAHAERGGKWSIYITHPGAELGRSNPVVSTAPDHRPTVLYLGLGTHSVKRGACLGCEWESEDFRTEQDAVEAAHDHAWPGWRALPGMLPPPSAAEYDKQVYARWLAKVKQGYPPGWLEAGGPIVTIRRDSSQARHRPGKAPGGGYDLAARYYRPKKQRDNHVQPALELEFP